LESWIAEAGKREQRIGQAFLERGGKPENRGESEDAT